MARIIAAAQRAEHSEMAVYGTVADALLTELAENGRQPASDGRQ
jgi:hypothetical protein